MRAEVGDVIVVNFWNRADRVFSVHPHGLIYDKEHEGDVLYSAVFLVSMSVYGGKFKFKFFIALSFTT